MAAASYRRQVLSMHLPLLVIAAFAGITRTTAGAGATGSVASQRVRNGHSMVATSGPAWLPAADVARWAPTETWRIGTWPIAA